MSAPASSEPDEIPTWTLGWRLKRALDAGDVTAQEMAAELGVHAGTVSRWMNDREVPRRAYLRVWAIRSRVPLEWLERGELPRVDSNHQPAGLWNDLRNSLRDDATPEKRRGNRATRSELLALSTRIPIRRSDLIRPPDVPSADRAISQ